MKLLTKTIQGKTIRYTRLGLGMAALGRPGYMTLGHAKDLPKNRTKEEMLLHAIGVLDAAWAMGIRHFDVARSYGEGELFLSTWLRIRNIDPDEVTISSKWGYTYTANWQIDAAQHEVKDHSLTTLRRQMGESSTLLGTWLKLYQIHSATLESGVLERSDVLDELARLRDGGLLIGLSVSGPRQAELVEKALSLQRGGLSLFGSVQATWNLMERSAWSMLQSAHQAGWLVIVKEGLANGRLTERGLPVSSPLTQLSQRVQHPVDAMALAAILAQPWVDIALSGAAAVSQIRSNGLAENIQWEAGWDKALGGMMVTTEEYWKERGRLAWN